MGYKYSPTPNTQDFMIVIDAKAILETNPNPSSDQKNPLLIENPNDVIFILTKQDSDFASTNGSNFTVIGGPDNQIQWKETTLTRNTGYNVQFYNYVPVSENKLISSPTMQLFQIRIPVPNPLDPREPTNYQKIIDFTWLATILETESKTAKYDFSFVIMNREGIAKGYFHFYQTITLVN